MSNAETLSSSRPSVGKSKGRKRLIVLAGLAVAAIAGTWWVRHRITSSLDYQMKVALKGRVASEVTDRVARLQANVAAHPTDAGARWELAEMYQKLGLVDLAAEQLEVIHKLDPDSANAAIKLADLRLVMMDARKSEAAYREATQKWPKRYDAWQGLATALYHKHHYTDSLRAIRQALQLEPKNPNSRYIMATTLLRYAQQYPNVQTYSPMIVQARKDLETLLPTWPVPSEIHLRLGSTCVLLRDFKNAEMHFKKALEGMPDRPDVVHQLAQTYVWMGRRAEARKFLTEAIARGVNYAPLYDLQGQLIQSSGEPKALENAIKSLEKAVALSPKTPSYLERYGGALARLGRLEESRKALEASLVLNPERAFPYQQLSAIYTRLGDIKRATAAAKMATRMVYNEQQLNRIEQLSAAEPSDTSLQLILADRYRHLKMVDAARDKYVFILNMDPANRRAKTAIAEIDREAAKAQQESDQQAAQAGSAAAAN